MIKRLLAGCVFWAICVVATPASADFDSGVRAYDRGDYETAFEAWMPLARDDDPAAQRNIAHLYRFGLGVAQDFKEAAYWYREASEMGLSGAQANLAIMYLRGQGLPADAERAGYWFGRAAVAGHAISRYNLGLLYLRGEGVDRDEARAMGWFHLAAKSGHRQALEALSKLVLDGATVYGPPPPPGWRPAPLEESAEAERPETATGSGVQEVSISAPTFSRGVTAPADDAVAINSFDSAYRVLVNAFHGDFSIPVEGEADAGPSEDGEALALATPAGSPPPESTLAPNQEPPVTRDYKSATGDRDRLSEAMVAFHAGKHDLARGRLLPLARAGMVEAQYQLGLVYSRADEADRAEGYVWLTLAAERGHPKARRAQWGLIEDMDASERQRAHRLLKLRRGGVASK